MPPTHSAQDGSGKRRAMLSPDPDLVVKSEAVSEQLLGRLQSYSNYPPVVTAVP